MTNPPPSPFARLRFRLAAIPDPNASDAELIARFVATRNEAAFAELVRRHGPLVLAVCRRVTGNREDADDAFQASFLVLARKPGGVRPDSPLAAWLYGVAVRAARKAVARTARRRARETTSPDLPDVPAPCVVSDPDTVRAVLDELTRLSAPIRAAVVLCELEGRSRATAAKELGIAEGTLSSRLAAARKTLARRFRDRGLAPAVLAGVAGSAACPVMAADAARLGDASVSPVPRVEQLAEAMMKTGFSLRWAAGSAVAVVVSLGFAVGGTDPTPLAKSVARFQPAPKPAVAKVSPQSPNKLLFYRAGHLMLINPDGKNEKKVSEDRDKFHPGQAKLSPDGKMLAVLNSVSAPNAPSVYKMFVRGVGDAEPGMDLGIGGCLAFAWSPDGTELVCSEVVDAPPVMAPPEVINTIVKVKTQEKKALQLPKYFEVTDWSRDGQFFVTSFHYIAVARSPDAGIFLMNRDGTEHKRLTDKNTRAFGGKLSVDGKRLLCRVLPPAPPAKVPSGQPEVIDGRFKFNRSGNSGSALPSPGQCDLAVIDVASGKVTKVEDVPLNAEIQGYCWSPDGKKIAYVWREVHQRKPEDVQDKETESSLVVCDPDGKAQKTIASEKGPDQWTITLAHVDWR